MGPSKHELNNLEESVAMEEARNRTTEEPRDHQPVSKSGLGGPAAAAIAIQKSAGDGDERDAAATVPNLIEMFPMRYRHFRLKIFRLPGSPSRYFYEPIVLLDPRKIQALVDKATGQAYVRLSIQMWDAEVEGQVVDWLKRLPGSQDVEDYCVQIMPFETVRLVMRTDRMASAAYRPSKYPTAYQLDQSLPFHLMCDSKEVADSVAESLLADPAFATQDLALECTAIRVASSDEPHHKRSRRNEDGISSASLVRSSTFLKLNIDSSVSSTVDSPSAQDPTAATAVHNMKNEIDQKLQEMNSEIGRISQLRQVDGAALKKQITGVRTELMLKLVDQFNELLLADSNLKRQITAEVKEDLKAKDAKQIADIHLCKTELDRLKKKVKDLKTEMQNYPANNNSVVPLFSAIGLETDALDYPITYQRLEFEPDETHGEFDESTGLFRAHTAGLYLFQFNGTSWLDSDGAMKRPTLVELRVNGICKGSSYANSSGRNGSSGYNLSISALVHLSVGSTVGVVTTDGCLSSLDMDGQDTYTRFSGILLRSEAF